MSAPETKAHFIQAGGVRIITLDNRPAIA
jgi:hypothetical protein